LFVLFPSRSEVVLETENVERDRREDQDREDAGGQQDG
jgi:hypothetical protein